MVLYSPLIFIAIILHMFPQNQCTLITNDLIKALKLRNYTVGHQLSTFWVQKSFEGSFIASKCVLCNMDSSALPLQKLHLTKGV